MKKQIRGFLLSTFGAFTCLGPSTLEGRLESNSLDPPFFYTFLLDTLDTHLDI